VGEALEEVWVYGASVSLFLPWCEEQATAKADSFTALRNDKQKQATTTTKMRGSLRCGGKGAAVGRDDGFWVV
jgi:hypothetical protein